MSTATMSINERSLAIGRARRALQALGEHPRSSTKELGHAREHLNACYSHGSSAYVWEAVSKVEAMAERRYAVPRTEEQDQLLEPNAATEDPEEPLIIRPSGVAERRAVPGSAPADSGLRVPPAASR